MEQDRYAVSGRLYVIGMVCLLISLTFCFFAVYIIPFLIWRFHYDIPIFVLHMISFFEHTEHFTPGESRFVVWLIFLAIGLIAGYCSYLVSNSIDNRIYKSEFVDPDEEAHKAQKADSNGMGESFSLGGKIILLMALIIGAVLILEKCANLTV